MTSTPVATRSRRTGRAQTTLDFAIGAGVFLIAIAFVVAFVPGMFVPFDADTSTVTADRVADSLAKDLLGDPGEPGVLDANCTVGFFEQMETNTSAHDDCRFDTDAGTLEAVLGVDERTNVTVEHRNGTVIEKNGQLLAAGENPVTRDSVAIVRRTVLFDGESRRLVVRVW